MSHQFARWLRVVFTAGDLRHRNCRNDAARRPRSPSSNADRRRGNRPHRMRAGLALALVACAVTAQNLPELVRHAQDIDPAVAAALAQMRAAEERVAQAQAGYGPTAALTFGNSGNNYYEANPIYGQRELRATQASVQVTQPVVRGSLWPALESARGQLMQAEAALAQARTDSAQRLTEAAFEALKARDTLAFAQAQQIAAGEQRLATRRANQLGTAPITDVRDAEAKADAVAAQVLAAASDLSLRQQILAELAGESTAALLGRGLDGSHLPSVEADSVLQWLADAAASSPQIAQARQALAVSEAELQKAWLAHTPTIDATYNLTWSDDNGTVTSLLGRRGRSSTVGVNMNVPLFASGATQARVREAMAQRDKAQADLDSARKTVTLAVRQSFSTVLSALAQAKGQEAAVRSQALALSANRRAYEVGTKVNTEVLEAQTKLFDARRELSKARYDAWSNYVKLKAQTGKLAEGDFVELDALLIDTPAAELIAPRRSRP